MIFNINSDFYLDPKKLEEIGRELEHEINSVPDEISNLEEKQRLCEYVLRITGLDQKIQEIQNPFWREYFSGLALNVLTEIFEKRNNSEKDRLKFEHFLRRYNKLIENYL